MISNLQDEDRLLLTFFKTYSRFEYALKVGGYGKGKEQEEVRADWPKYLKDISDKFDKNANKDLLDASNYLWEKSPKRLIRSSNDVDWEPPKEKDKSIELLSDMIRCVRNNLFHGVKYHRKYDTETPLDSNRNKLLLQSCLVILDELRRLSPDKVQKAFEDAVMQL